MHWGVWSHHISYRTKHLLLTRTHIKHDILGMLHPIDPFKAAPFCMGGTTYTNTQWQVILKLNAR